MQGFAGQTIELRFSASSDFTLPTGFFVDNVLVTHRSAQSLPETGWYWNAAEGGRGWAIERQGDKLFAAAFMYEATGAPVWYVSTLARQTDTSYLGSLERYSGGQALLGAWRLATPTSIGSLRMRFFDNRNVSLTVSSIPQPGGQSVALETSVLGRFPISTPAPFLASISAGAQGWWWNPNEPGRGYFIEVQGLQAFVGQFGYNSAGVPGWYVSRMNVGGNLFDSLLSAPMDEYGNGQALGGSYRTPRVLGSPGSWSVRFSNSTTGQLTLPDGRVVPIQRFSF